MTSVDRIQGLSGSLAVKAPVRVATTAAITLAGEQTIDGVAVVTGDRVLVKDQGTTSTNGIYDCATGAWTRALDFDGANDVVNGTLILVAAGSVGTGLLFRVNGTNPITPGMSAITFTISASFASMSAYFATLMDDVDAATARATLGALGLGGGTLTGGLIFKAGFNFVSSAATTNLTVAAAGNTVHIQGTTGISAFTMTSGQVVDLVFDSSLLLTHHATNNNLPGGADITTAAGDRARYWYDGTTIICMAYTKADGAPVIAPGTSGNLLTSNGSAWTSAAAPVSKIVQVVEATPYTTYASSAGVIPYDNSIPQKTEGNQWNSVTITPTNASNRLRIEINIGSVFNSGTADYYTVGLFQDATADAIAAATPLIPGNSPGAPSLVHEMAAGTTSATTFKFIGGFQSSTQYMNGNASTRIGGGVVAVRMRVTEIKV